MNLIGHRGQDQSAGLIRSDYINHILHGTDVLRKIAKMPKWQSLCFIIYVMDINLVNHENLLNLVVDWFLRFYLSRCQGDNQHNYEMQLFRISIFIRYESYGMFHTHDKPYFKNFA